MPAGIVISWVEADRDWAEWVAYQIRGRGFPVHLDYDGGSNRVHEFDRMLDEGYRVVAVVSDDSIADQVTQGEWLRAVHLDPTGSDRRITPLLVRPGPAGSLAPLTPVSLHEFGDRQDDAADRLLSALGLREQPVREPTFPLLTRAEDRSFRSVDELIRRPPSGTRRVLADSDDPLPRLRVLSGRARLEAGQVSHGLRTGDDFGKGLYVRRDVAPLLLERLRDGVAEPQLLVGDPGTGKTSLLWGLAADLLADEDHEVFLLKATWLREIGGRPALVDAAMIAAAVERSDRACTLLVDTADLVVTSEEGHLALVAAVDAATGGGASVVVTSRPQEARNLPWKVVRLGNYATDADEGSSSEFERAVASHSRFYCSSAESAREMAARIISAVARRQPLGELCLRPLTLRMLFQLYAPSTIADNVDVTGLYNEFWRNRVLRDRRVWSSDEHSSDDDVDLSGTARTLALAMLRDGVPEVGVDLSFDPAEQDRISRDVDLLVRRGVGDLVTDPSGTRFRFFHQTFFEFSAAQGLLHAKGSEALAILEARIRDRPDDYLLLAVFEQAWLCACRDRALAPEAGGIATRMLGDLARTFSGDTAGEPFPYALQRPLLAVLAQGPDVPGECWELFGDVLAEASLPVVRDCLALMPPPQRRWTERDLAVLRRCADRPDAAWVSVLDVLSRLAQRDPELAVAGARRLAWTARAAELTKEELLTRQELPRLFADLRRADPAYALAELRELGRIAVRKEADNHLVTVIRLVLDRAPDLPDVDLAAWADDVVGRTVDRKQAVVLAHAEAHRVHVTRLAERCGWSIALVELKTSLAAAAAADKVASHDGALLGGVLTALASDGPLWTVEVVETLLRKYDEPQVHAEIHRGWLVGYTRRGPNRMLDRWSDWLVEGLPASHQRPEGAAQRWADTIRRTLERQDVASEVAVDIAGRAAGRLSDDEVEPWLDPDVLLRLVVRGAGVGAPGARAAVERIGAGHALAAHAVRTFLQQSVRGAGSPPEWEVLLDVLLDRRECGHLHQFLDHHPALPADLLHARSTRLRTLVESSLASHKAAVQRDGGHLLVVLVSRGWARPPRWNRLVEWLAGVRETSVRTSLVRVMGLGLDSGAYPPSPVRRALTPMADWDPGIAKPPADVLEARAVLVVLLAKWGSPDDADELLRLAFRDPVESTVLAKVSSFVRVSHRAGATPSAAGVPFLLEFGRLLKDTPRRTGKNTAVRWRGAMAEVLRRADAEEQVVALEALTGPVDGEFAASVVLQMDPRTNAELRRTMTRLLDEPDLDDRIRRNIRLALAEKTSHHSRYDWPTLPDLLKP